MATFNVTNTNDSGTGSLRQAILNANATVGVDIIEFDPSLAGSLIQLSSELAITDDVTIDGDVDGDESTADITIDAGGNSRVFTINNNSNNSFIDIVLANLTITGGSATDGCGIFNRERLTVTNSTVSGNTATDDGGGIWNLGASLTIENSTISDNSSGSNGGGIYSDTFGNTLDSSVSVSNSTISGNTASNTGGGIYHNIDLTDASSTLTIHNSTLTDNSAATGGGINNNDGVATLTSTIVAGNTSNDDLSGNFTSGGNNLIGNGNGSTGFIDGSNGDIVGTAGSPLDAGLEALADNGGPTLTHNLQSDSPAINAGSNTASLTIDQRGQVRTVDTATDIGAIEFDLATLVVDTLTDEADGDVFDGDVSLRDALANIADGGTITFSSDLAGQTITLDSTQGALSIANSSVTIDGSDASQLTINAAGNSRVLDIRYSNVLLNGITITGGSNSNGGGIVSLRSNLTVTNSTLTGNTATTGFGGALLSQYGTVAIANSTIVNNSAALDGGGVFLLNTDQASLNNNTLTGNTASEDGGAIATFANGGTTTTITNSLISGNRATGDGNEIFNAAGNSIVVNANNLLGDSDQTYDDAFEGVTPGAADIVSTSDNSSSATHKPTALANILAVDSQGDPLLQDNGGPTETIALVSGSPAINAGDAANIPTDVSDQDSDGDTAENVPFDQRGDGFDRVQETAVDIGAFERLNKPPIARNDGKGSLDFSTPSVNPFTSINVVTNSFSTPSVNPFTSINVGTNSAPALADVDGDGDLDVVSGEFNGSLYYYENIGSATAPAYTRRTGTNNPFNDINVRIQNAPTLADVDGDGLLDLVVGRDYGILDYYKNTGSATAPAYTRRTGTDNPFIRTGTSSFLSLADLDSDGDLDVVVGRLYGELY
ncbi:MAG: choice-of-anchor Q domain-containing protein, partial [Cyanobacteria bacterium P01_F01_bin.53]